MIVKQFSDGSYLEYAQGAFDPWCVFLTRPGRPKYAPRDYQYFQTLNKFGIKYGRDTIYHIFCTVYDRTTSEISRAVFRHIEATCIHYGNDRLEMAILFSILYMGMVAEEKKENTRLGKRIKRLGVYQVLIERMEPNVAANFSRSNHWYDLDDLCLERGF